MTVAAIQAMFVLLALVLAFQRLLRAQKLQDTALLRVHSVGDGLAWLRGIAAGMSLAPQSAPLSGERCAWWWYRIESRIQHGTDQRWLTVAEDAANEGLHVLDGAGMCIVDTAGARIVPSVSCRWRGREERPGKMPRTRLGRLLSTGPYRYLEKRIHLGELVSVHGAYRSRGSLVVEGHRRDIARLLADWRDHRSADRAGNPPTGDAIIDMIGWENAHRTALDEMLGDQNTEPVAPDLHVVGAPASRAEFAIRAMRGPVLIRRCERQAMALMGAAMLMTGWLAHTLVLLRPS
jgi:hypothetical protein